MGREIALQFKKAFPKNFQAYKKACDLQQVVLGKMFSFETDSPFNPKLINNHMDRHISKTRHIVENIFATLKYFRGLAIYYYKPKSSYISNIALAGAYVWLKL